MNAAAVCVCVCLCVRELLYLSWGLLIWILALQCDNILAGKDTLACPHVIKRFFGD